MFVRQKQMMKPQQVLCERPSGIGPHFWFLDYGCSYWIDRGIQLIKDLALGITVPVRHQQVGGEWGELEMKNAFQG